MDPTLLPKLLDEIRVRHPRSLPGVEEARRVDPERFAAIAEMYLEWLVRARGEEAIPKAVDAFAHFSTDVNLAQARYEAEGRYANTSYAGRYEELYSRRERMDDYLWGVYLTNFLWAHHTEICLFYHDRFLSRLGPGAEIVELAPGHGGWGVWALSRVPGSRLRGFDVSPSSIAISRSVATAAGVAGRAEYAERDVLKMAEMPEGTADAIICCFLVEHLENPADLLAVIARLLRRSAPAFLTGAITAAQDDHIHEFRRESDLVRLCEEGGFRVLETLSVNPRRTLPKARFLPRSMALVIQKRVNDLW